MMSKSALGHQKIHLRIRKKGHCKIIHASVGHLVKSQFEAVGFVGLIRVEYSEEPGHLGLLETCMLGVHY